MAGVKTAFKGLSQIKMLSLATQLPCWFVEQTTFNLCVSLSLFPSFSLPLRDMSVI